MSLIEEMEALEKARDRMRLRTKQDKAEIQRLTARYADCKETFEALRIAYIDNITIHEAYTDQIIRLGQGAAAFKEKTQEKILELDKKRFELHRVLETMGTDLGKSKRQVDNDLIAYRFSGDTEQKVPGLLILSVTTTQDERNRMLPHTSNPGASPEFSEKWDPPIPYEGIAIVYTVLRGQQGVGDDVHSVTFDHGAPLKTERITALHEKLRTRGISTTMNRQDFSFGGWHVDEIFEADVLFVPTEAAAMALDLIQKYPEKYWITSEEFQGEAGIHETHKNPHHVTDVPRHQPYAAWIADITNTLRARGFGDVLQRLEQSRKKLGASLPLLYTESTERFTSNDPRVMLFAALGRVTWEEHILERENGSEPTSELYLRMLIKNKNEDADDHQREVHLFTRDEAMRFCDEVERTIKEFEAPKDQRKRMNIR